MYVLKVELASRAGQIFYAKLNDRGFVSNFGTTDIREAWIFRSEDEVKTRLEKTKAKWTLCRLITVEERVVCGGERWAPGQQYTADVEAETSK